MSRAAPRARPRSKRATGALAEGRRVLQVEAHAIQALAERLDESFARAVEVLHGCAGKVAVTGMGKSGLVGRKIASTLASTGTPAFFLHPAEAIHGDLGMLDRDDVVLALSNSGETEEVLRILPLIKRLGCPMVVITGGPTSRMARAGDVVLDVSVDLEACPLGLAPTSSTTAALAMGDALAMALLVARGFQPQDFAARHPGGSLGRQLFLKVSDLMHTGEQVPRVSPSSSMRDVIVEITAKHLGAAAVVDKRGELVGIVTDGDLRRALERHTNLLDLTARDVMTARPKRAEPEMLAGEALRILEHHKITVLLVCEPRHPRRVVGVLHMHDLLRAGVA
ncbi:MAG: KpsF/GutQ family sugar-phosphate isomerase [Deltaproteobacteria bacterium]|nr:KpsF/GutQ family sugar-phosphate isomerase [Deltaproteobacteria bacterium]